MIFGRCPKCSAESIVDQNKLSEIIQCSNCLHQYSFASADPFLFLTPEQQPAFLERKAVLQKQKAAWEARKETAHVKEERLVDFDNEIEIQKENVQKVEDEYAEVSGQNPELPFLKKLYQQQSIHLAALQEEANEEQEEANEEQEEANEEQEEENEEQEEENRNDRSYLVAEDVYDDDMKVIKTFSYRMEIKNVYDDDKNVIDVIHYRDEPHIGDNGFLARDCAWCMCKIRKEAESDEDYWDTVRDCRDTVTIAPHDMQDTPFNRLRDWFKHKSTWLIVLGCVIPFVPTMIICIFSVSFMVWCEFEKGRQNTKWVCSECGHMSTEDGVIRVK